MVMLCMLNKVFPFNVYRFEFTKGGNEIIGGEVHLS